MNKEELAQLLDGRQCRDEITREEEVMAKENGLLVIFGASDDLTELRGFIDEETYPDDGRILFHNKKIFQAEEPFEPDQTEHMIEFVEKWSGIKIEPQLVQVQWDNEGYSWTYETDIPHATFEITDDDDKYCRGIVIDSKDLLNV